jgi:mevalonate kinase
MSKSDTAFFPGKVILTGEHSVVYGHLAILASLDLGKSCSVSAGELSKEQQNDAYLQHLLGLAARTLGKKDLAVTLQIDSTLPTKAGLGSSAALAAAVLQAVTSFFGRALTKPELYQLVLEAENFIHGRSSGADPAIVVYGGLLAFQGGQATALQADILAEQNFFLINSGAASESTGEMVTLVKNTPNHLQIIEQIAALSLNMHQNLQKNLWQPELLTQNQILLEELGVVGETAKKIVGQVQEVGAHAKITGAGGVKTGSGYILATHDDASFFASKLQELGLDYFAASLGQAKRGANAAR